jgi:hypothetical protein
MNDIRRNLIEHKRAQGFIIEFVGDDPGKSDQGRALLKIADAVGEQEYRRRLLEAPRLDAVGFQRVTEAVRAGANVSADERLALERTRIEGFYRAAITDELVQRDDRGRARERVVLFEEFTNHLAEPVEALPRDARFILEREHRRALLRKLLETTPVVRTGKWDSETVFSSEDLQGFCGSVAEHKKVFETQLGRQVRADLEQKPAMQLGHLLRLLGLGLARVKTKRVGHRKIYFYRLDPKALAEMRDIAATRATLSRTDFLGQYAPVTDDDEALRFFGEHVVRDEEDE